MLVVCAGEYGEKGLGAVKAEFDGGGLHCR